MAQLELPAPVWTLIVSKLIDSNSSESWKTLRLVCKALCARAGYFAKQLRLQVDADLPRNASRCMERGFRADTLHLFSKTSSPAAQHDQSEDRTSVLLGLFQLPIWSHLRTLRLRGVDLPESVLLLLPQACPNLQELFLEDVVLDHSASSATSTSSCDVHSSGAQSRRALQHMQLQLQQEVDVAAILPAQELPAVAVRLRQLDVHGYEVQLCSIPPHSITKDPSLDMKSNSHSHNTNNGDSATAARIALILSNFKRLRLLRMDCALAERVMQMLCDIHQRPCLQVQCGSMGAFVKGSASMLEQPLLEYYPLLGWYLFNVTGAPCSASSSSSSGESSACRSASSVQLSNSIELQPCAAAGSPAIAEAACSSVGDVSESEVVISTGSNISSALGGLMPGGSISLPAGSINSSSCPPSANNSSHQLAAISDSAAAYQAMQQQQLLQEAEHICQHADEVLAACIFAASHSPTSSTAEHQLDVNQQHCSRSSETYNNAGAEANSVSANDVGSGRGRGSLAVSCCNLGEANYADPELCSCGMCSFCSEDGNEEVCNSPVHCSNSTLAPSKVQQGRGDSGMHDALNNSASDAARDDDTFLGCMDQQQ